MNILIAPLEALTDSLLSDPERRVLLALFSYRGKVTELVFPSLDALAERSNIKDKTRVSKITTSLAKKGWLTKKKKGFTGCNQYTMCMPERLTNLDSQTKLAPQTKLDANTNSNLDSDTKYDVGLTDQVQRTHQLTNHINKPIKETDIDFQYLTASEFNELTQIRMDNYSSKKMKAPKMTQRIANTLINQISLAITDGHSIDYVLNEFATRGWLAIKAEWLRSTSNSSSIVINQPKPLTEKQVLRKAITASVMDIHNTDW
jgi:hypothetical protein